MHTQIKKRISVFLLSLTAMLIIISPAFISINTANADFDIGLNDATAINVDTNNTSVKTIIANIINIVLGFLGIIAVIIIIFAGFKWMTASGNEDQVAEAKKMLTQAVVGLAIVFFAYIIVNFVTTQMGSAVTTA